MVVSNVSSTDISLINLLKNSKMGINQNDETVYSGLSHSTFNDVEIINSHLIDISNSELHQVIDNSFTRIKGIVLDIRSSKFTDVTNIRLTENENCIYATDSVFEIIKESVFDN